MEQIHRREFQNYVSELAARKSERTRSFLAIKRMIGDAAWLERAPGKCGAPFALFGLLRPRGTVTPTILDGSPADAGALQDCVTVDYLAVGALPAATIHSAFWMVEVQEHALARLLQRHPGVDLEAALRELHRNLLRASTAAVEARYRAGARSVLVPAAAGVFLCTMASGVGDSDGRSPLLFVRTKTWVPCDQPREQQEQEIIRPASDPDDEPLGARRLLPCALRHQCDQAPPITLRRQVLRRPWAAG